jgi:hypothetical protein
VPYKKVSAVFPDFLSINLDLIALNPSFYYHEHNVFKKQEDVEREREKQLECPV